MNDLMVEAADFLCTLSERVDNSIEAVPLPESVVAAMAIRAHRQSPVVIDLGDHYAKLRDSAQKAHDGPRRDEARAAEEEPHPKTGQARKAGGQR
jgi:hypothetical protein